jgi:hypothetical protein
VTGQLGCRVWAVPGGRIPGVSHGIEPEFTSFDQICILNTSDRAARLQLTIYYEDDEPAGPYPLAVDARRVRHVRLNDLVDPEAIYLGRPYGCVVEASTPVVVQFSRQDTRLPDAVAITSTIAFPTTDLRAASTSPP